MALIYKGKPKSFGIIHDKKSKPITYNKEVVINNDGEGIVEEVQSEKVNDPIKEETPLNTVNIKEELALKEEEIPTKKESAIGSIGYKPINKPANIIYGKNNFFRAEDLTNWVNDSTLNFTDDKGNFLDENDPKAVNAITAYWKNIGINSDDSKFGSSPIQDTAWSAATISNAVMALTGKTAEELKKDRKFRPSAKHSIYINDGIKNVLGKGTKFDLYAAKELDGSIREVGDILFKGRKNQAHWTYRDFVNAVNTDDYGYDSHSDIITGKGKDDKGTYYTIAGGNVGNTLNISKVYYDPKTGELKDGGYKGVLEFNKDYKGSMAKQEFIDVKPKNIELSYIDKPTGVKSVKNVGNMLNTL